LEGRAARASESGGRGQSPRIDVVSLRVYVMGRIRVEHAGRLIDEPKLPARQGRVLFAYLICHRQRPVTRAELAEALWPGELPSAWEAALNALVSKLRSVLKQVAPVSLLGVNGAFGAYGLHAAADVWIDREAAAEAIDHAEGLLRADRWQEAWAPSNIAAITARQPFLAGDEGEWIDRERARQHGILLRSLTCLIDIWQKNGEPALALSAAKELVALEPFSEAGYRRLMRVHVALGDRAEALRVFEACRTLLAKELGAKPSAETQRIHDEIRETT
jgi:DNA-binding SARP family transcriptional activator